MEFQIFDCDYVMADRPVIRLFGRTDRGKSICAFVEGFTPYFYVTPDAADMLADEQQVVGIEKVRKKMPSGYGAEIDLLKVYLRNPAKTPEVREHLVRAGAKVFEADIPFKYRWMTDSGLGGMSWVKIKESEGVQTMTASADKTVHVVSFERHQNTENAPMKVLALDIECVPTIEGTVPDAGRDPVIMVSLVFSPEYNGRKTILLSTRPGEGVCSYDGEKELLEGLMQTINGYDCDIITGFNINNFDIPYILTRMEKCGVRPVFGRCGHKQVSTRKLMSRHKTSITGRMIVDSFEIIKKDFSMKRYGLDWVAPRLLGANKIDVKHSEIAKLWKSPSPDDFSRLVTYCTVDSVLAMDLLMKLNLIDKYIALSKLSGVLLQDILDSGETARIEMLLLREFNAAGFVLPCKPDERNIKKREQARMMELAGGFVMEPKKGIHSSVIVLDFKSMYPSLIRTYNMCPSTIMNGENETSLRTPANTFFVKHEVCEGVVPKILKTLMDRRQEAKTREKEAPDENQKRLMHAEQWALKIMANAFYGYFGYPRAKLYNMTIANTVTASGRNIIQETKKTIEDVFGYEVIYGDTDSVMVKVKTDSLEEMNKIGNEISRYITDKLPGVIELQFEKVFRQFLALTKKRYMGWCFEPSRTGWKEKIETKGIETVRRDWCEFTSETMKAVIEIILKRGDTKAAVEYFKGIILNITAGRVPLEKLLITKTMSKSPESYPGIQPHIELVKKMKKRSDTDVPGIGDRIAYVIVKGPQILSQRAEDPRYVQEKGLQIDPSYYIDNQLMPPLERIFINLGVSKNELLGRGRQTGVFDVVKNGAAPAGQEIRMSEVDGFICTKCRSSFRRPPLSGICQDCGGELLFSSAKGPARLALA